MNDNINDIFKAFIPTRGKAPTSSYTNPNNQYRYEEVQSHSSYAGILAPEAVLVDVDSEEEGEILLKLIKVMKVKCRVHKTTHGMHAFFIGHNMTTTRNKWYSAVGLHTDWKLGTKKGYAILKLDGQVREVVYDTGEIGELPCWLYPIAKHLPPEFEKMKAGDGRNDALFRYILTLQSAGLTKEQSRETIRIINQYIFKEPLSDRELSVILRDGAFPAESFYTDKGKLKVGQFEEHFCKEVNVIKLDKTLHFYNEGRYVAGEEAIRGKMLEFLPELSFSQRNEVMNRSKDRIQKEAKRAPANLILFRNGTYDTKKKVLLPSSPKNVITNMINWNYNPDAYCEITDKTLNRLACDDPVIRALLEELIGYCFYRRNELGKAFILLGDASNGKSTFLDILAYILGEDNISSLSLQQFGEKFDTAEMHNKLANIGDDIPDSFIVDPSIFKKIVTGDRIQVQHKHGHPFSFIPFVKSISSANEMPRIDDKTGAVKRRLIPIPFKAKFTPDDPDYDPYIKDKLKTEESVEYLIKLGIDGLERILSTKKFTTNKDIENELNSIDEMNNPLLGFIEDIGEDSIINQSTKAVYDKYRSYCVECGLYPATLNTLVRQLNVRLGTMVKRKMIQGETIKIFVKKEVKD